MNQKMIGKRKSKSFLVLMLILSMILGMMQTVQAEAYDPDRKGSLTINLKDQGTELLDVELLLYRVGTLTGMNNVNFALVPELEATGVDLNNLATAEDAIAAADILTEAVNQAGINPFLARTDSQGVAVFSNLEQGVYLMVQPGPHSYGVISPLLVAVPYTEDGADWNYDVAASPKASIVPADDGRIEVTKRVSWMNENMEIVDVNVADGTYYVGLFYDEAGDIPYSKDFVKPIRIVGASSGTAVYEGLPAGTYYVLETDAEGTPIPLNMPVFDNNGKEFTCIVGTGEETDTNQVELALPESSTGSVVLNNVYTELPDDYYLNATISITKLVMKEGAQTTADDTFYAGIFRVEDNGDEEWIETVELKQNDTVEVEVPLGGEDGRGDITYMVRETDEDGQPVDKDTFKYEVSGEKQVKFSEDNTEESVNITNTVISGTPSPSPTASPTPQPTTWPTTRPTAVTRTVSTSAKDDVKTGDETPVGLWIGILGAAAVMILGAGVIKRKKSKKQN